MTTLDDTVPKWKLNDSLIGTNPGLGVRPIPDIVEHGSLIWYNATNSTDVELWVNRIDIFLESKFKVK